MKTLADRNVSKLRNRDKTKYETSQTKHNFKPNDKHKNNWKNKIEKNWKNIHALKNFLLRKNWNKKVEIWKEKIGWKLARR